MSSPAIWASTEMRGRQFGFLVTLCSVWIAARVGFLSVFSVAGHAPGERKLPVPVTARTQLTVPATARSTRPTRAMQVGSGPFQRQRRNWAQPGTDVFDGDLPFDFPEPPTRNRPLANVVESPLSLPLPNDGGQRPRLNIYAYSFFRHGLGKDGFIGNGQYGGSQSGFVATYALAWFGSGDANVRREKLALLGRGAIAHDRLAERELAVGVRWTPLPRVPVTLTAEHRFRHARPDAGAFYLSGGMSQTALPLEFRLETFAQAGIVSGSDGGPFFDASVRAQRSLVGASRIPVTIGAGAWAGGQKDVFRIDVGPTVGTEIPVGDVRMRLNADWRFRIAGGARPANGPALTLSTSF